MFKIKYVGPRPTINQHGIFYKNGKEDKYLYLMDAIEILISIDHDYSNIKSYSYILDDEKLSEKKIHTILQKYDTELEKHVIAEEENYETKIQNEIQAIKDIEALTQIEKEVWIENIKIMKKYRIQRAINKIYYMHCIEDIKKIIRTQHIKEIDTPFNEHFWHILSTIQGKLETGTNSVSTKLIEENKDDGEMIIKLYIIYNSSS